MFKNKMIVGAVLAALILPMESSFAAFGSRASSKSFGVSRSISRSAPKTYSSGTSYKPKASSYSAPKQTYSKPNNYNNNYSNQRYNNNSYNNGYQQNNYRPRSAMGDIGVGVASVAGGILAAEAIQGLIRGPSGAYTHPQYPGQYFNAQGAPITAPNQDYNQSGETQQDLQQYQGQQPAVAYQAPLQQEKSGGFFSFLWGALGNILHLILFPGVVGALLIGGWKLWGFGKKKLAQEKINMLYDEETEFNDLDSKAQEIFYNFQKNSDDQSWVERNTKYLNVEECLSPASTVVSYEHKTLDCATEQGKLRASVKYVATLKNEQIEKISQIWNFEKENGIWKLIGVESV